MDKAASRIRLPLEAHFRIKSELKKRPKLCKLTVNKPFSVNKKGGREMRHPLQKSGNT